MLACLDGYMNIAMEQTEEYVNGQLKAKYGDTFIRGNNGESSTNRNIRLAPTLSHVHKQASQPLASRSLAVLYISTQKKRT